MQGYINQTIRFLKADCQQIMQLGHLAGIANRSEAEANCVRKVLSETQDIEIAINTCSAGLRELRGPNGVEAPSLNLMEALLGTTGVTPAMAEIISDMVPNIELSTAGNVFTQEAETKGDASIVRLYNAQQLFMEAITAAVDAIASGAEPEPVRAPGQPIPIDALRAMTLMDPILRDYHTQKLAGNLALAQTVFDILEAATHMRNAAQVTELSDSQREAVERAYETMRREADRLKQMKQVPDEAIEPHVRELLIHAAEHEAWASDVLRRPQHVGLPNTIAGESHQNLWGYAQ